MRAEELPRAGRRLSGIAVVLLQALAVSCAQLIGITPAGHVDRAVTFSLHDAEGRPFKTRIRDFIVYEETADSPRPIIWDVTWSQPVKVVTYGQALPGVTVRMPARALARGSSYRIAVSGERSVDYAAATFRIDADGTVIVTSPPVRGARPSDGDMKWFARYGRSGVETLMPVDDQAVLVVYRSHRDLYYEVQERYFSIRYGDMSERGFDRDNLEATVVAPVGRSIQAQLLDLHMKDRAASFPTVLARVAIRRISLKASACPAIRARLDALSGLPLKTGEWDVINLHPVLHRIVLNGSNGRIDATLENDGGPMVSWASETYDALLKCAG